MDFQPHRAVIRSFLDDAQHSGVTDSGTHHELVNYLDLRTGQPVEVEPPEPPPPPTSPEPPPPPASLDPAPRPAPEIERPAPQPRPAPATKPAPALKPVPPTPARGELSRHLSAIRQAVVSDLSLHGFAYLGVLVIFACVLGLLLFAFADIPDAHQPFYELVIAFVFFGFAWYLRRQHAIYVARAMELIGGMALPLVLFAGLVDNAPIPPDFQGTGLIVALTLTALTLSIAYGWWSARHDDSMLGHLIAPLWWLAALTLGFVFKTDEPLIGDAITRLLSHQPALAAAAVGLTLVWVASQRRARLADGARTAALVGAPVAYLLTIALAAGEGWVHTLPLVLAGAATFVSTELLVRSYGKTGSLVNLRPFLLAGVIMPVLAGLDLAVAGVLVVVAFAALFEWTARTTPSETTALSVARAGMGLGAVLTLTEGWAALVVFSLLSVWAHYRRVRPVSGELDLFSTLAAALAPLGVGYALTQIAPGPTAWAYMAGIVLSTALVVRVTGANDEFWARWPSGAALLVAAGAIGTSAVAPDLWRIAAVAGAGVTLGIGPRWPMARLWASTATTMLAVAEAALYLDDPLVGRALVFAALGLAVLTVAIISRGSRSGHLAAIGHLLAAVSLVAPHTDASLAIVAGLWTGGWILTTIASSGEGDSLTTLLLRVLGEPGRRLARWLAPVVSAVSIPATVVLALRLWPEYAANPSWVGPTLGVLGVVYAVTPRAVAGRGPIERVATLGAVVMTLLAPALSAPERLPLIVSLAAGVLVSLLLARRFETKTLSWYGWAAGHGLAVLLVEQAGVKSQHLDRTALIIGVVGLVGSLLADDRIAGRREPGQGLRVATLRYPVVVGAITATAGLLPLLAELPGSAWWVIAAGAATVAAAYLSRIGLLSGLGHVLISTGVIGMDLGFWMGEPWRLVILAAPLVAIALVARWHQPKKSASNDLLRWDLAALMVAHAIAGVAVLVAFATDDVLATCLVFGVLSVGLGAVSRNRMWLEAGNGLLVLAAVDAGAGWPSLILGITAVRGGIGACYGKGMARLANHLIGAIAGGIGWAALLAWQEVTLATAADLSALVGSVFALVLAIAGRLGQAKADSVRIWGGTGVAITVLASWFAVPMGVEGPLLALGLLVTAAVMELSWPQTDRVMRYLAVATAGMAWLYLVAGSGWEGGVSSGVTALVFGVVGVVVAETSRRIGTDESRHLGLAWGGLALLAVVGAVLSAWGFDQSTAGYLTAAGVAVLGFGAARAATPLAMSSLRATATLLWLTSVVTLAWTARWPAESLAIGTALVGAMSTFAYVGLWVRGRAENWKRPLNTLAVIGNLIAVALALYNWPAPGLTVAIALSLAAQAIAVGIYRDKPALLALAPPLTASAFFIALGEGFDRHPLWYTVPLGIVALSELEILRHFRRHAGTPIDTPATLTIEALGLGLLVLPALVSMFGGGLAYAGVALLGALICLVWAGVTRVKRRAVAAAALALATTVLAVVAAAAGGAPESVAFWITGAGIGSAVLLVAGFIEAYRSKKGHLMMRLDRLMEGWE